MNRFRFTLLAVCLVLVYLGYADVSLFLRNRAPLPITMEQLASDGAPREWLHIQGAVEDLEHAISTSGSIELSALLVPLKSSADQEGFSVLLETRNPELLEPFKTYHFLLDSALEKERYLEEHKERFQHRRDVTGMLVTGLIATGNRDKLMTLARELGMQVSDEVIFVSEGKEPARWRGFFFLAMALGGLFKFARMGKKPVMRDA
ncbi:hypothetical protein [Desulfuromonas versatilis]|nr:hypothetical protein [Desulfuromonas versatilis]